MSSGRGKGSCHNCNNPYANRYKPRNCPKCGFEIGGSHVPKKRVVKPSVPASTLVFDSESITIYSVATTSRNNRCFVTIQDGMKMCQNATCKKSRAVFVHSKKEGEFTCKHSEKIDSSSQPKWTSYCNPEKIENYSADDAVKTALVDVINEEVEIAKLPHVVQVSEKVFAVLSISSASDPIGYTHINKESHFYVCTSKDCKASNVKTKQLGARNICLHIHMLLCCLQRYESEIADTSQSTEDMVEDHSAEEVQGIVEEKDSISRQSTRRLHSNFQLPYKIDETSLKKNRELDSKTILGQDGWPDVFEPSEMFCGLCGSELGASRSHPGSNGVGVLITFLNPFQKVEIKVKICREKSCQAMHRVFPTSTALFNISDKVMLSIEILLEWRESFRRGVPVTVMIEAKIASFIKNHQEAYKKCGIDKEYLVDILYNGFYGFEAITERDLNTGICGICGIIGELYLGDGNEKNCCSTKNIKYPDSNEHSSPLDLETFMSRIKQYWLEKTIYTRSSESFDVNMVDVPPIIPPALRSTNVQITESEKKSDVLKRIARTSVEGDSAMLHHMIINDDLQISNLRQMDRETLVRVCKGCGIKTAGKSVSAMQVDLQTLYATLLAGHSPCHQFTQVPGHTGGFYHLVCRHGCTVASKFLLLQESTRDPADLYLSLRYPPLVFVCDTPCGVVRHMDCRNPEISKELWGDFAGCFEKPIVGKLPEQDSDVPDIVPLEYRRSSITLSKPEDYPPLVHPVSGKCRRYILGDRFHAATNPHKSPLCEYHDINLCRQANVFGTSYQEAKNHQKNKKRLRSSCVQSFGVHFLYNFLMDFYENEEIVEKQKEVILKSIPGKDIKRDSYKRFYFE